MFGLALSLSLSLLSSPDTTIKVPLSEITYIMPCTWKCSCDWNKIHSGWIIMWKGKAYNAEGDRIDGKHTPEIFINPNKK